ncbi:ABC transporter substrate-binding protein [Streptomyces sp. NBC_01643]|uniref:ABC transporter substrate-binding protein n=1 Tax=Streptomyces sp. NBC_01643 TaxID=2975906 RepID=UPI003870308C|nr:ABC transporter substrate-binding protein [Streptomyces sp. NBC_01643]
MNVSMKGRGAIASLLLMSAVVTASGCSAEPQKTPGGKPLTTVTYRGPFVTNGGDAPYYYAQKLGYYAEEGLKVEIRDSKGSGQTVADVNSGGSDVGMAAATNVILAAGQGQDVTSVATVVGKSSFGFFVPQDSSVKSIANLKGKSIAVTALVEPNMYAALSAVGLSKRDVKPVIADANALITTYLSGKVDSMYSVRHFAPAVQRRPSKILLQSDAGFNPPDYALLIKPSTLRKQPDVVKGFVRATLRGFQAAKEDPQAAVNALLAKHPELDPQQSLETLKSVVQFMCAPTQQGHPYGENLTSDWTTAAKKLQRFAGLSGDAHGDRFFTNQLFKENGLAVETC